MGENLPRTTWRLIISDPLPGRSNMAQDAAILAAVGRGEVPPTLRLYRWSPPCLSLGYSQPAADVDLARLQERGWELVRRPTGGRAILHTDELTYSVIGPKSDPRLDGSLMDSYRRISQALFQALQSLGLPVEVHQGKNPLAHHQPVCFENPSDFEITVRGKKIIGSAQARKKEGILQHGSLPLSGDLTRITQVLHYPTPQMRHQAAEALLEKGETVAGVLGREISWEKAASAFVDAFQLVLNLDLEAGELTPAEKHTEGKLVQEQYGNPAWTRGDHLLAIS
jgi:lipoate-protein ligase A